MCLGFKPGAAGWQAETIPLSYDGTHDALVWMEPRQWLWEEIHVWEVLTLNLNTGYYLLYMDTFSHAFIDKIVLMSEKT